MRWQPDPTFYPSPRMAMEAPAEKLAYVAMLNPTRKGPDAMGVIDVDEESKSYGRIVGRVDMPNAGDELHHFGWNACSSCLCPYSPHPHMERRYLVVPGLRSSRIHILDTKADPRNPKLVKVIEPETVTSRTGYSRPHTVHCGPEGIYMNALGSPSGDGPGGIFVLDGETFDVRGTWEIDRGPQYLAYDFWWHLGHDTLLTSEWGTPNMVEDRAESRNAARRPVRPPAARLGPAEAPAPAGRWTWPEQQMVWSCARRTNPTRALRLRGRGVSLKDLSASIWLWYAKAAETTRLADPEGDRDSCRAGRPGRLAALLKGFGAVPPLITDINLSLDDRFLYVSCFGSGEFPAIRRHRSVPTRRLVIKVRIGGIVRRRAAHPSQPDGSRSTALRKWWS